MSVESVLGRPVGQCLERLGKHLKVAVNFEFVVAAARRVLRTVVLPCEVSDYDCCC